MDQNFYLIVKQKSSSYHMANVTETNLQQLNIQNNCSSPVKWTNVTKIVC